MKRTETLLFREQLGLPARIPSEVAAQILGFRTEDMPVLVANRCLRPLGSPPPSGPKYYALVEILKLAEDSAWLARASDVIVKSWRKRNARRNGGSATGVLNGRVPAVESV